MADVRINIITTQEGQQNITQAADALNDLGKAGQQSGDGLDKTTGSLGGLVKGAADAYGAFNILTGALKQGGGLIQGFYDAGVSAERLNAGLNALSGGKADAYITAMSTATKGLISNSDLARDATLGLSSGLATDAAQMSEIARIGATLGTVFMNDAAGGVTAFENAMETGATRGLKTLGINIDDVRQKTALFKSEGLDTLEATRKAMLEVGGAAAGGLKDSLDGAGTAVDRVNAKLDNLKEWSGTRIAIGIDATINLVDVVSQKHPELVQAMLTALAGPSGGLLDMNSYIATHGIGIQTSMQQMGTASLNYGGAQAFRDEAQKMTNYRESVEDMRQQLLQQQAQGDPSQASAARSREASVDNGDIWSGIYNSPEGQANMRNSLSGVSISGQKQDMFASDQEKEQRLVIAARDVADYMKNGAAATGQMDGYAQHIADAFQKVNNTSIAQAFGTTSGGIGGEIGGGLSADVSAERAGLVKKGASKAELAQFDDQAKSALDNYKIATGQATPESIKFGDALTSVDKAARAGKISTAEAANEYLTLANAAKNGATSVGDLEKLMGTMTGTGGTTSITHAGGAVSTRPGMEDARHGGGMKTAMLPFDDVKKGADDTLTKVTALTTATTAYGPAANDAASVAVAANGRISQSLIIVTGLALAAAAAQRLVHQ